MWPPITPSPIKPRFAMLIDPDRLDVGEFADAVSAAEFATVAGPLYAPERQAGVGGDHLVDEDHSALDFVGESVLLSGIVGPCACAEAEATVIGQCDRFVYVFYGKYAGHGAE